MNSCHYRMRLPSGADLQRFSGVTVFSLLNVSPMLVQLQNFDFNIVPGQQVYR